MPLHSGGCDTPPHEAHGGCVRRVDDYSTSDRMVGGDEIILFRILKNVSDGRFFVRISASCMSVGQYLMDVMPSDSRSRR